MLSGTGLNPFYYVRDLTEMCCTHSWGGGIYENSFTASHVMEMSLLSCYVIAE